MRLAELNRTGVCETSSALDRSLFSTDFMVLGAQTVCEHFRGLVSSRRILLE